MILETKRLILRPWELSDASSLYQYASDPDVGPSAGWAVHTDIDDSRRVIREILSKPETYAVVRKGTDEAVGSISLMFGADNMSGKDSEPELGYWIGKPFWGNGYIPEAAECLIRRAFADLNADAVWCGYYEGNDKSRRVGEKCGFSYVRTNPRGDTQLGYTLPEIETKILREQWLSRVKSI